MSMWCFMWKKHTCVLCFIWKTNCSLKLCSSLLGRLGSRPEWRWQECRGAPCKPRGRKGSDRAPEQLSGCSVRGSHHQYSSSGPAPSQWWYSRGRVGEHVAEELPVDGVVGGRRPVQVQRRRQGCDLGLCERWSRCGLFSVCHGLKAFFAGVRPSNVIFSSHPEAVGCVRQESSDQESGLIDPSVDFHGCLCTVFPNVDSVAGDWGVVIVERTRPGQQH